VVLNRDYYEIINDTSKPTSILLDESIIYITLDQMESLELLGRRGDYIQFNCANCGFGLLYGFCPGCKINFPQAVFRGGTREPLSRKIVNFLCACGHSFKKDPKKALKTAFESVN
jgi:hypothetical protein